AFTVVVSVTPTPEFVTLSTVTCSGVEFQVSPVVGVGGGNIVPSNTLYTWTEPSFTGTVTGGQSSQGIARTHIFGTLSNRTHLVQTVTYTVTPITGNCTGAAFTVLVTLNPTPEFVTLTTVTCSGIEFQVSPAVGVGGGNIVPSNTQYRWNAPSTTGTITGGQSSQGLFESHIFGTLSNRTHVLQTATYSVTPRTLTANCTGSAFTVVVSVTPTPEFVTLSTVTCSGVQFQVSPAVGVGGGNIVPSNTKYTWLEPTFTGTVQGGQSSQGISRDYIFGTLSNRTNTQQTVTYTVTPQTGNCTGSAFTVLVSVNPTPEISAMSTTVCSGLSFLISPTNTINGIVPAGTSYTWDPPATSSSSLTGGVSGTSIGTVTGTLTNGTNVLQSATYIITPRSANNCLGAQFTAIVYVDPKSVITAMSTTICSGILFRVTPTNITNGIVPEGTTYTWLPPAVSTPSLTGGQSASAQTSVFGTLRNGTNTVRTAVYTVIPSTESCGTSNAFTVTVFVNPTPEIDAMTTVVCSGITFEVSPVNLVNGIVPASTTYSWEAPAVSTLSLTGGVSGSGSFVFGNLLNRTNTVQTATYQVRPVAPTGSCTGQLFTVTVTVNPGAYIEPMTTAICSGVQFSVTPQNGLNGVVPDGTTYNWTVPAYGGSVTGGQSNNNQFSIFGTLTNNTNSTQTAVYTVTPNVVSCATYSSFTLTVFVTPTPKISPMSTVVCSGVQFEVSPVNGGTNIVPANTTYSWQIPAVSTPSLTGGQSNTGQASIYGTLINNTNTTRTAVYTVTPTAPLGACTGSTFTVLVTVNPKAVINTMTAVICSNGFFQLTPTNQTNGIVPDNTSYTWAVPSVTSISLTGGQSRNTAQSSIYGSHYNGTNSVQTATYTVVPSSPLCGANTSFTVIVTVNPVPQINAMSVVTCSGVTFTISPTHNVNGIIPVSTIYNWDTPSVSTPSLTGGVSGNATSIILANLTNNTNVTQTAVYSITPTAPIPGSCAGATFTVTVFVNPKAVITEMSTTVCSGTQFNVTPVNGTNGIVPLNISYGWNIPAVSNPSLTGGQSNSNQAGIFGTLFNGTNVVRTAVYTVVPSLANCPDNNAFTLTVYVNPRPQINAMSTVTCSGVQFTINPSDITNGIVPVNTLYNWGTPSTSTPSLTGAIAGNSVSIITGTLNNSTSVQQSATYIITPTAPAPGSCPGAPFTAIIFVNPQSLITEMSTTVCSGLQFRVTPTDGTNGIVPEGTKYTWTTPAVSTGSLTGGQSSTVLQTSIFGTLFNATNTVRTAVYTVTPNTTNCSIGTTFTVTVYVDPTPAITAMTTVVCSGVTFEVSPVNVINGIVPANTQYSWNQPSVSSVSLTGGITESGAYVFGTLLNSASVAQTATYQVRPTNPIGNCAGSVFTVTVTVNPGAYIAPMTTAICSGVQFSVTPQDGVNGVIPVGTTYNWGLPTYSGSLTGGQTNANQSSIFGTLTNSSNVTQTAVYTVTPNVVACASYASFTLTVFVTPTPNINALSTVVCSGLQFNVTPVNGGSQIVPATTRYAWEIPAVSTPSLTGGQSNADQTSIYGILTNNTNTTRTAVYSVRPTTTLGNCAGVTFTLLVTVNPIAVINPMSTTVCSGLPFNVTPTNITNGIVPDGTTYSWGLPTLSNASLTGGQSNNTQQGIFGTITNGTNVMQTAVYTVIPNTEFCGTNSSFTLTVFVNPKAEIRAMTAAICSGVQFTVTPQDLINGIVPVGTVYSWNTPNVTSSLTGGQPGSLANAITGTLNSSANVTQTAVYIVTPRSSNCGDNLPFTLTVSVNPIVVINTMTLVTCSGVPFVITPTNGTNGIIPGDTYYTWSAPAFTGTVTGGQSAANQSNIFGTLVNQTNTTQTVTYTVAPSTPSCISNAPFTVIVTLRPIADIRAMSVVTCSGTPFVITPTDRVNGIVPEGTLYRWSAPSFTASISNGASAVGQVNVNGSLRNTSNIQQTATYFVTPTTINCNDNAVFTVTVTVNPTAEINTITTVVCSDITFVVSPTNSINGIVPDGTKYSWSVPAISASITGGASGTSENFVFGTLRNLSSIVQTATYSVSPRSAACTGANFTVIVTLNPGGSFDPMTAITCNGVMFEVTPTDGVNGIIPANTKYSWNIPSFNPFITGGQSGTLQSSVFGTLNNSSNVAQTVTYFVTPNVSNCGTAPTFTLTVTINPTAEINLITTTTCSGVDFEVSPRNSINGIVPDGTLYRWSVPSYTGTVSGGQSNAAQNRIFGNLLNRTNTVQTVTYSVIPTSLNCGDDTPFTVVVTLNPTPEVSAMTTVTCSGVPFVVTPSNDTNGIVPANTLYSWPLPT
ncbi:MAG: hypothetical protein IM591_00290, partial [Chitinophagaceae bacterium]|nr:hypothetical protein [Chitinophagaceae bacterium]